MAVTTAPLVLLLALACLLLSAPTPSDAACPPSKTPYHCKQAGDTCVARPLSECIPGYKCLAGRCTARDPAPPDNTGTDDSPPASSTPSGACILPVSPFVVRTGTPDNHLSRHPADTNYKNVKAVDLVTQAGQAVYAVEDGKLSTGGSFAISSGSSAQYGYSFELITDNGQRFFYTHLANPLASGATPGARVKKGQLLGWVERGPNVNHLHFAFAGGNPCSYLRGCRSVSGAAPAALPC